MQLHVKEDHARIVIKYNYRVSVHSTWKTYIILNVSMPEGSYLHTIMYKLCNECMSIITAANVLCTSMASPNPSSLLYIGGERHSKSSSKRIRRKRKKFVKRTWPWDRQRLYYSLYCTASVYWLLILLASMKLNWVDTKEQVIEKERGIKIYTNKFLSLSVSLQLHLQYLKLTQYQ